MFTFGDAHFYGSLGPTPSIPNSGNIPIVGLVANSNFGYRLITPTGVAYPFGTTP